MKLPELMQDAWCQHLLALPPGADLGHFSDWITEKSKVASIRALLLPPISHDQDRDRNRDRRGDKRGHNGHVLVVDEKKRKLQTTTCAVCSAADHRINRCPKFLEIDVEGRWQMVVEKKLCFRCLGPGHRTVDCESKSLCTADVCEKRNHHTLLHRPSKTKKSDGVLVHVSDSSFLKLLLRVVPFTLFGQGGQVKVNTYALLDEGSTLTLMEAELSKQLGLTGPIEPLCMQWTHDVVRHDSHSRKVALEIYGISSGATKFKMNNVRTVTEMNLPAQSIDMAQLIARWPYLKGVPFESFHNKKPRLIIGHDNYLLTTPRKVIHGAWTAPVATRTWLGWVVHGSQPAKGKVDNAYTFHVCNQPELDLAALHNMVKESFTIENMGVKLTNVNSASKHDMRAQAILEATTARIDGRWQTGLLWRNDNIVTPDSKPVALRRLACLKNRMDSDALFASGYCTKMRDLLEKGYVRKLLPEEVSVRKPREWYLPHFGVVNLNKPGKLSNSAFISISDEIHSQRFYWRGLERTADPEVYAVVVVCFGATSSPCNANYCKIRNSEDFKEEFPEAHKMVVHQSYMDDYMGGADTEDATAKLVLDLIEVHRRGSMELCNWTANSKNVLSQIPSNLKAAGVKDLSPESDIPVERVLGMHWDPQHDFFTFKLNYHKVAPAIKDGSKITTRRQVLQLIMSVFDPLGIVGFFVIKGRILLQDIWKVTIGWDEQISKEYATRWKKWVMELPLITSVQIPRCYSFQIEYATSVQLHTFCDASEQAYSAVAYLRFVLPDGAVEVAFVSSKCRVAPLKQLSIPRLELQAALLAVRLSASIKKEIQMEFSGCWYCRTQ